ncbi:unnamed protein product, partial [Effrenium voratum]
NVYGQNDAPVAWYRTFDSEALKDRCTLDIRMSQQAMATATGTMEWLVLIMSEALAEKAGYLQAAEALVALE